MSSSGIAEGEVAVEDTSKETPEHSDLANGKDQPKPKTDSPTTEQETSTNTDSAAQCQDQEQQQQQQQQQQVENEVSQQQAPSGSNDSAPFIPGPGVSPMSKNQRKRQRRWENLMKLKKQKKEQQRKIKQAKAKAEGRDLEKERAEVEERTRQGDGHKRREEILMKKIRASADNSFKVCVDCSFEDKMTYKEVNSLATQVRYCYGVNKRSKAAVYLTISSLGGTTEQILNNVSGFPEHWVGRGFDVTSKNLTDVYEDTSKIVYLTSDSDHTIEHLEDDKIYVIGGVVDRNRLKRVALERANALGVKTARLPIDSYLSFVSTHVLTCNHVFEILLKYKEYGRDWKKAMMSVLPQRKDIKEKDGANKGTADE